ncbi:MAG TPA: type II toxin-antitoxin system RelE/ParE family toxin [Paraburkholderia sp.]|nr:type II toxin-antitoxin system RelE/ParE family toxin [Paraburkholderia sp.]
MTIPTTNWTVRLTQSAQQDFSNIIRWSAERFGKAQARTYATTVSMALQELTTGPKLAGIATRDDIAPGLLALHVARKRRKGRHFILLRVAESSKRVIDVLRILHDAMDLPRHEPGASEAR